LSSLDFLVMANSRTIVKPEPQVVRRIQAKNYVSAVQLGDRGYCGFDLEVRDGKYLIALSTFGPGGEEKRTYSHLGATEIGAWARRLDWDVADPELREIDARVRTNTLLLNFSLSERFDISTSNAPPLLKSMATTSSRNSWWALPYRGFTFVFSAASAFQRWLTPTQDVAAYLLSPFGELAYDCISEGTDFYCWIKTSQTFEASGPNLHRLAKQPPEVFLCLAYWLGVSSNRAELALLSKSMEFDSELKFPMHDVGLPTSVKGIRVGKTIYVQGFTNLKDDRWPVLHKRLMFVQARRSQGVEIILSPEVGRPTGCYQVRRRLMNGEQTLQIRSIFASTSMRSADSN